MTLFARNVIIPTDGDKELINLKEYRVEHVSATMQVVNAIKQAIRDGELKEGDKLPNEAEMAKALGVGRSSFREGMRILNAYGVVEIRQGEGTFIINRCAEQVFELLGFFSDDITMKYLIELREIIETGSLKLTYSRITEEQIARLKELADAINYVKPTERNIYVDKEFHVLLIQAADNPLLSQIYTMLSKMQVNLMNRLMCYEDVVRDAANSHHEILQGIVERDEEKAVQAMRQHLVNIKNYGVSQSTC